MKPSIYYDRAIQKEREGWVGVGITRDNEIFFEKR